MNLLDISITDGLLEINEFANELREKEAHLTEVLCKYIKHECLEKELGKYFPQLH